jgi:hypothetical protein
VILVRVVETPGGVLEERRFEAGKKTPAAGCGYRALFAGT